MKVCPEGWRLPSDEDWMELEHYMGMQEDELDGIGIIRGKESNVGGKLKEIGYTYWKEPNEGANNESGFSALPGGILLDNKSFSSLRSVAYLWSSSSSENNHNIYQSIYITVVFQTVHTILYYMHECL
jgi:uncharacterized protein (TIGR02145 family)